MAFLILRMMNCCIYCAKGSSNLREIPPGYGYLRITINILKVLKTQLRIDSSYTLLEKRLLWFAFTLAFYGFLRGSEFASSNLLWSDVELTPTTVTIHLRQSKTDPFRHGQSITLQATSTSTCPVRAINLFNDLITIRTGQLYCGGRFDPLSQEQLTRALRNLLQLAGYKQNHYASHSFGSGAATTAAVAGLPAWLIKAMGRWSSDAYHTYIHCPTSILQSNPRLLSQTDAAQQPPWDPNAI